MFPLFFGLIYIMVSYGLLFALQHSITEAAKESARVDGGVRPDDRGRPITSLQDVRHDRARATAAAALDWLPADLRNRILGAGNEQVQVTFETDAIAGKTVEVLLELPDYAAARSSRPHALAARRGPPLPEPPRRAGRRAALNRSTRRETHMQSRTVRNLAIAMIAVALCLGLFALRLVRDLRHSAQKPEVADARKELPRVVVAIASIEEGKSVGRRRSPSRPCRWFRKGRSRRSTT